MGAQSVLGGALVTHAEVMKLAFEKQERELEALRILAWQMEFRRRVEERK